MNNVELTAPFAAITFAAGDAITDGWINCFRAQIVRICGKDFYPGSSRLQGPRVLSPRKNGFSRGRNHHQHHDVRDRERNLVGMGRRLTAPKPSYRADGDEPAVI